MGPTCLAMILCHSIRSNPAGEEVLDGVFNSLVFPSLPGTASYSVYLSLTGGKGHEPLRFDIASPSEEVLASHDVSMEFDSSTADYYQRLDFTSTFREPGTHVLRLWRGADELVCQRRLEIVERKPS